MKVLMPDGKVALFPDDMPIDAIQEVINRQRAGMPTVEQKSEAQRPEFEQFLKRQALPIAGDVAISVLAPQVLPARLATRAPLLFKTGQVALSAAGSAAGSAGGEYAAQKIFDEKVNPEAIKEQAVLGGSFDLVQSAISRLAGPTASYIKNMFSGGSQAVRSIRNKLINETTEKAEKFIYDLAPSNIQNKANPIEDVGLKMKAAMDETRAEYDVYENAVKQHFEKTGEIDLQNTFEYLEDLRENVAMRQSTGQAIKEGAEAKTEVLGENRVRKDIELKRALFPGMGPKAIQNRVLDEVLASYRNGVPVSPESITDLMAVVFKKGKGSAWENLTGIEKKNLEGLKTAIKKDLDFIPAGDGMTAKTAKEAADENFKAIKKYNSVLELYEKAIRRDEVGRPILKPWQFVKNVYEAEGRMMKDPVLKDIFPKLKEEADKIAEVANYLRSDKMQMKESGTLNNLISIPVANEFASMSAYGLLDPVWQKRIQSIVKYTNVPTQTALKTGARMFLPETGE